MEVGVFLDEFGREAVEQAEQVMCDKHLSVTARARADSDGGNGNLFRDQFRETRRDRFKHDAETARGFEKKRILHEPFRGDGGLALRAESAQLIDGLRGQTEMPHDGNARAGDGADGVCAFTPALEFDRVHAALCRKRPALRTASSTET
jgi:hypothetical protein